MYFILIVTDCALIRDAIKFCIIFIVIAFSLCYFSVLELCGVYGEGEYDFKKGFVYITFINNASQVVSIISYLLKIYFKDLLTDLLAVGDVLPHSFLSLCQRRTRSDAPCRQIFDC